MFNRVHLFSVFAAGAALGSSLSGRPNILLIQTDDQGYDDVGIHHPAGENLLETPNIDRLAEESVRFENFYMSPVCAPSRAMVLTGRHHYKAGVWWVHAGSDWLNLDETTVADVFSAAGYRTVQAGKWHSGKGDGYWPWDRGFETGYYAELYVYKDNQMIHDNQPFPTKGWTEQRLADVVIDEIHHSDDRPFFIYYNPLTAHMGRLDSSWKGAEDIFAPPGYVAKYEAKGLQGRFARLYGALSFLDDQVGRVFQALKESGQWENTIVLFMSDNGSLHAKSPKSPPYYTDAEWELRVPSGMRGEKGMVDENGIRSYCFIRVPGAEPGVRQQLTAAVDVFPTVLDLAGISVPATNKPLDGLSLKPLLESDSWSHDDRFVYAQEVARDGIYTDSLPALNGDREIIRPQPLFDFNSRFGWIHIPEHGSVRQGHWKWSKGKLYDMRTPEGRREQSESIAPEVKKELAEEYERWWQDEVEMNLGSFRKPLQFIGWPDRNPSILYPFCAIERTGRNVKIKPHEVTGFRAKGDELFLPVEVKLGGEYQTTFFFEPGPAADGALVEVAVGSYRDLKTGEAVTVSAAIQEKGRLAFPKAALPAGKGEMRIRLIRSGGQGNVFAKLQRIELKKM